MIKDGSVNMELLKNINGRFTKMFMLTVSIIIAYVEDPGSSDIRIKVEKSFSTMQQILLAM